MRIQKIIICTFLFAADVSLAKELAISAPITMKDEAETYAVSKQIFEAGEKSAPYLSAGGYKEESSKLGDISCTHIIDRPIKAQLWSAAGGPRIQDYTCWLNTVIQLPDQH